ncbi:hypothetical protein DL763_005866 [Monosporascus cannonballus]|nr:hypothetical protein DL763_005866 [Monosporascus cannonballus]
MHTCLLFIPAFLISLAVAERASPRSAPAPLIRSRDVNLIPDKYIVKLNAEATLSVLDDAVSFLSVGTDAVFNMTGFRGFAGTFDADALEALRNHPEVEYIEQDAEVKALAYVTQDNAPWGLARVSHRNRGSTSYVYDSSTGAGTCTYVIDTGIYTQHVEFEGRASNVYDSTGETGDDLNGHGTHVAGIAGSRAYGVAKRTRLLGVKVLNRSGSGTTSAVIQGFNFVAADAPTRGCPNGAVANIAIGGSFSAAVNQAAASLVRSGVFASVAAGGSFDDAARYSPASEPTVCTVGATTANDEIARFSNYGSVVDVFAPGASVLSAWYTSPTSTNILSGTSQAAAYLSGLGAYLLALEGPRGGAALCERIKELSTKNVLLNVPAGTGNRLAFNGNPSG